MPRGAVDFFQGEKFMYSDYGLAGFINYIVKRRGGSVPIGLTYDVMCHWIVNFATRAKLLQVPPSNAIPEGLDLIGAVPKWHLGGHKRDCFVRWSLDNMQHVGRMEGEGPERFWSMYNQMSGSMSEQGPGVRTDNANNIIRSWNEEKAFGMVDSAPSRYIDAKKNYLKQKEAHDDLNADMPPEKIADWERESLEPTLKGKKWESPMMDPDLSGGFRDTIKERRQQESVSARVPGRRPGATRWLSDGIELEHSVKSFNDKAKDLGDSPTSLQGQTQNGQRLALQGRIESHRKRRELYMEEIDEPDQPRIQRFYEEIAEVDLGLPSSYMSETLDSADLASLVEVERELRRSMCRDSLASVKRLLGAKAAAKRFKDQNVRGQIPTTRANSALKDHDVDIRNAQWRYNNSYKALVQLGTSASDDKLFRELKNEHITPLAEFYKNYAETVGHGRGQHRLSWIWATSAAPNTEDEVEGLKTERFRSRERYKRWREQLILVKREMVMTIRSFQKYEELWTWKSRSTGITPGMRAYAAGRAKFFAELAYRMLIACNPHLYDDTVELKWASNWLKENVIVSGNSVSFIAK
ncbi:unnamed protein product [Rhizoctonia solani]|uniref:Uncharacterized protein n=1 Tax=Rhizoctonia solani TaxID=456999 RepID=A0A8H3E3D1_9AGAM|nr:unnamed protein product [Rhizoctonia solani]